MNTLTQRVLTAVVLVALLLAALFMLPEVATIGLLGLFLVVAAWEWSGFLRIDALPWRAAYVVLILVLTAVTMSGYPGWLPLVPILWLSLVWWGVAFIWVLRYPTPIRRDVGAVCGILVMLPAWVGLVALLRVPGGGPVYVLFALVIVWAADIGAYFIGRRFGQTKLAPEVSPGKTWEGFVGGLLAAGLVAGIGAVWLEWPAAFMVPMGLCVAAISVMGDLTVSMFKRSAGLKDSGHLFPGHGGVLDRIDSITAAMPLFALGATWMGLLVN